MEKYIVDAVTVKGRHHEMNEDNYYACDDFIVVADGMGGESDGNVASKIAVDVVAEALRNGIVENMTLEELRALTFHSINKADSAIVSYVAANPASFGMGTTVIIVVRQGCNLYIAWCGDSRCYVYGAGRGLRCITKDHSYVQNLIDSGSITVEESYTHPDSNLITRYVGGGEAMCQPEFATCKMHNGDIIVVCSDGLSGYCMDGEIECAITAGPRRSELGGSLLQLALQHGSDDDITVVTLMNEECSHRHEGGLFGWLRKMRQV